MDVPLAVRLKSKIIESIMCSPPTSTLQGIQLALVFPNTKSSPPPDIVNSYRNLGASAVQILLFGCPCEICIYRTVVAILMSWRRWIVDHKAVQERSPREISARSDRCFVVPENCPDSRKVKNGTGPVSDINFIVPLHADILLIDPHHPPAQ